MDYKEYYEAALAKAERIYESATMLGDITGYDLVEIFPELSESEDERIRKRIYGLIYHNDALLDKEELLAWLEKQKGQNSPDSTGLYYYDGKKFTCCGFPYNFTMNQQEEKKTVAISENNNADANGHLTGKILVEYGAHAKVRDGKRHCEMDWKEFQRLAHYFYELGKAEQQTVGWSEEDDEMYINVASSLRGYACGLENEEHKKHIKKGLDWLENRFKSISPQPKVEWSEEDEKIKERLITRLNWITYNTRTDGTSPNITFFDEIAWLKSLRPQYHGDVTMTEAYKMGLEVGKASHWRPGEEQMEALDKAIPVCMGVTGREEIAPLESLYNDLKKLM